MRLRNRIRSVFMLMSAGMVVTCCHASTSQVIFQEEFEGVVGSSITTVGWTKVSGSDIKIASEQEEFSSLKSARQDTTGSSVYSKGLATAFNWTNRPDYTVDLTYTVKIPVRSGTSGGKAGVSIVETGGAYFWKLNFSTDTNRVEWSEGLNESQPAYTGGIDVSLSDTVDFLIQFRQGLVPKYFYRNRGDSAWTLAGTAHGDANGWGRDVHNAATLKINMSSNATSHRPWIDSVKMVCGGQLRVKDYDAHSRFEPAGWTPKPFPGIIPPMNYGLPPTMQVEYPDGWQTDNVYSPYTPASMYTEPGTTRVLQLIYSTRGIADGDDLGNKDYKTWYRVSTNGGWNWSALKPLVQQGLQFDKFHPIRGVWRGKNAYLGYSGHSPILRLSNGDIVVPLCSWPLGPDGLPYNPYNATTFSDGGCFIGKWVDLGNGEWDVSWNVSRILKFDLNTPPLRSTRGADESAIAELSGDPKGRLMMVIRGSNQFRSWPDRDPEIWEGRKWISYSNDYGRTWSLPEEWKYADGNRFFSPSTPPVLYRSPKNGRLYYIGHVIPNNPDGFYHDGNGPRFPMVMGEVDETRPGNGLKRETVITIDSRNWYEPARTYGYDTDGVQLGASYGIYLDANNDIVVGFYRYDQGSGPYTWILVEVPT